MASVTNGSSKTVIAKCLKTFVSTLIKLLMISRRKIWQISNKIILAIHIDVACHKMLSYIISTLVQNRQMYLKSESMYLIMVFAISIGGELAQKFLMFDFANCCAQHCRPNTNNVLYNIVQLLYNLLYNLLHSPVQLAKLKQCKPMKQLPAVVFHIGCSVHIVTFYFST